MNLLLVEPDKVSREAILELLQLEWPNMNAFVVENDVAGHAVAKEHELDLILLACSRQFERSRSSIQTASSFRQAAETRLVPLIAIISTSFAGSTTAVDLMANCDGWLLKPFSAERLYQVVSPFALASV